MPQVSTILASIDDGFLALPTFQRGYVWNGDQVRALMHSLYRRHPVGTLLVWKTTTDPQRIRGEMGSTPHQITLLLDGQQRVTTLYGVIRGAPPPFFDGNASVLKSLMFSLGSEVFEFFQPVKMRDDPRWIDVTRLMREGPGAYGQLVTELAGGNADKVADLFNKLSQLHGIQQIDLHEEQIAGVDDIDVVVDIFNRINSGGTKLSKGDLALARICAAWPEARDEMKAKLARWTRHGYSFSLDWLLRNVNAIVTGRAPFAALADVDTATFQDGLNRAERTIDRLLNLIASRLGLDHGAVLGGHGAFPLMSRYLHDRELKLDAAEQDRLLYWYVHTFLWGRYTGSTETVLQRDLQLIADQDGALDRLLDELRQSRGGDLRITARDFSAWSRGSRFYPLLYMLTRVNGSRDWGTGIELRRALLGTHGQLELHHIFPKAVLRSAGYTRAEINAVANFTFLTMETNREIAGKAPQDYLASYLAGEPGAVETHWLPSDPSLWQVDRYREFLTARRELLAAAANGFLTELLHGRLPGEEREVDVLAVPRAPEVVDTEDDELAVITGVNDWVVANGLSIGTTDLELLDPATGDTVAVLDLAWPLGLQLERGEPVALMLNEDTASVHAALAAGYRPFQHPDELREWVERTIGASAL
jgi:hypothetical protein